MIILDADHLGFQTVGARVTLLALWLSSRSLIARPKNAPWRFCSADSLDALCAPANIWFPKTH